jgi:hypothetical protein
MGIAWSIPRDGRIRLSFDLHWLGKFINLTGEGDQRKGPMIRTIKEFKALYDKRLEQRISVDFCILDSNLTNQDHVLHIYRPGSSGTVVHPTQNNRLVLAITLYGDLLYSS